MIEVIGLANSIVISDQCLKTSNINLLGIEKVSSGRVTVKIVGDVGSITSAIQSIENVDNVISSSIIPSLDSEVFEIFKKDDNNIFKNKNLNIELEINNSLEDLEKNNLSNMEVKPSQSVSSLEHIKGDTQNNNVKDEIFENQITLEGEKVLQNNNDSLGQKNVKQLRELLLKNTKLPYKEVKKMKKDELIKNIRNNLKGE